LPSVAASASDSGPIIRIHYVWVREK
jgi:hypothetical protein